MGKGIAEGIAVHFSWVHGSGTGKLHGFLVWTASAKGNAGGMGNEDCSNSVGRGLVMVVGVMTKEADEKMKPMLARRGLDMHMLRQRAQLLCV